MKIFGVSNTACKSHETMVLKGFTVLQKQMGLERVDTQYLTSLRAHELDQFPDSHSYCWKLEYTVCRVSPPETPFRTIFGRLRSRTDSITDCF